MTPPPSHESDSTESLRRRVAELESQLAVAMREMAEMQGRDALKTQFLANISHDLRTPLTAIITHGEILRDGILGSLTERQRDSIMGIINGGRHLLGMVGEILTYARGAAHQLTLSLGDVDVGDVVRQVVTLNESLAARKDVHISRRISPDVRPVRADRDKVTHVLANLVGNAIDFTPPGGRVWIHATRVGENGGTLQIEVGDTGIGIAREHHELIFREFAQVDSSASRRHHGTGLGLTIARKLVELHNGTIWLDSDLGSGSRFYFTIPYDACRKE